MYVRWFSPTERADVSSSQKACMQHEAAAEQACRQVGRQGYHSHHVLRPPAEVCLQLGVRDARPQHAEATAAANVAGVGRRTSVTCRHRPRRLAHRAHLRARIDNSISNFIHLFV